MRKKSDSKNSAVRKSAVVGVIGLIAYALFQYGPPWVEILTGKSKSDPALLEENRVKINSPSIRGDGNNVEINVGGDVNGSSVGNSDRSIRE